MRNFSILDLLEDLGTIWTFQFEITRAALFARQYDLLPPFVERGRPVLRI